MELADFGGRIPIMVGAGLAGAGGLGGLGYGGWCFYEMANPTLEQRITRSRGDAIFRPLQIDLKQHFPNSDSAEPYDLRFASELCFRRFFGETKVDHFAPKSHSEADGAVRKDPFAAALSRNSLDSPARACAMVHFDHRTKDRFSLHSELVVKTERYGWALWAGFRHDTTTVKDGTYNYRENADNLKSGIALSLLYQFIYLERVNDDWTVRGGYFLNEKRFDDGSNPEVLRPDIRLVMPNEDGEFTIGDSEESGGQRYQYHGMWREDEDGDQELFEDFEFRVGTISEKTTKLGIFGEKIGSVGRRKADRSSGKHNFSAVLLPSTKQWLQLKGTAEDRPDKSILTLIGEKYRPLAGRHGTWTSVEKLCRDHQSERSNDREVIGFLRKNCYVDQSGQYIDV